VTNQYLCCHCCHIETGAGSSVHCTADITDGCLRCCKEGAYADSCLCLELTTEAKGSKVSDLNLSGAAVDSDIGSLQVHEDSLQDLMDVLHSMAELEDKLNDGTSLAPAW
jgi:hypothetical protein